MHIFVSMISLHRFDQHNLHNKVSSCHSLQIHINWILFNVRIVQQNVKYSSMSYVYFDAFIKITLFFMSCDISLCLCNKIFIEPISNAVSNRYYKLIMVCFSIQCTGSYISILYYYSHLSSYNSDSLCSHVHMNKFILLDHM